MVNHISAVLTGLVDQGALVHEREWRGIGHDTRTAMRSRGLTISRDYSEQPYA
jgi:hypothetical protein